MTGRIPSRHVPAGALLFTFIAVIAVPAMAQTSSNAVTAGALKTYSTIYSIGVEWTVLNDADHDAAVTTEYREQGASAWKAAQPLVRVDFNGVNMLAGSLFFLSPATAYDLRLSLTDPDGGGDTRTATVRTRPLPSPPAGGRIFHVVPGAGGGDGTALAPFAGIAAAQAAAQAGDTFLLHTGQYGGRIRLDTPGTASEYIAWKAAGDGEVVFNGIDVAAGHLWLEGLTIEGVRNGLWSFYAPTDVVVLRCRFLNDHNAIILTGGGTNWYIADNTIVGDTPALSESLDGEGIELNTTSGHTVAYNSITNVADGVSYPDVNVDIFGNDIFDTSDDGIELDYGRANVRVWGNRIHNAVHNGISFQPQAGGPWYIIRNQIVGNVESAFKFRTTDRFVLLHNTIVNWGNAWPGTSLMCCNEWDLLRAIVRNNLWVSVLGGQIWGFETYTRDWRSDLDYDGFDWGSSSEPFSYDGMVFPDVGSFASASGLEEHGIRISKSSCFTDFQMTAPSPATVPPHVLTLRPGCEAVDSGEVLPGINDDFAGSGPDRGAHESGRPTATFGPRPPLVPPPAAPGSLTASVAGSAIELHWSDNSANEAGFRIERSAATEPFLIVGETPADVPRYTDATAVPGTSYTYRVSAFNQGGSSAYSNTASGVVPKSPGSNDEIVLYAGDAVVVSGKWQFVDDSTAASGRRLQSPDAGVAKLAEALGAPASFFELTFSADAGTPYHLWIRGKAAADAWTNDSAFVQFDNSVTASGAPIFRIGTTSAAIYSVEDCSGCGLSGWGWQDNAYGTGALGPDIYFAASGLQRLRIQVREDGLGIDQIVLSAATYLSRSPGATKNDTTILTRGGRLNTPPAIQITSPTANTQFAAPATVGIVADAVDADGSVARVEFLANGTSVGSRTAPPWTFTWNGVGAGSYLLTARSTDNEGATTTSGAVQIGVIASTAIDEIVLYAKTAVIGGGWIVTPDPTAAGGARLQSPDAGVAKLPAALAAPVSYFDLTFNADAGTPYHLWIRGKAASDAWTNDSAFVQFDNSVTATGSPVFRIGTTSAAIYSVEDCSGCGLSGWGWQDTAYGTGALAPEIYFATTGPQRLRIQVREDGLGIDQIVLSAVSYLSRAPGATKNDTTILSGGGPAAADEVVLYAKAASIGGGWILTPDPTAAGGARLQNPDAGAAKLPAALGAPLSYFDLTFSADAGRPYHLWVRGKAAGDAWTNDSAFVQFDNSVTADGTPVFRIGTSSATIYSVEDCSGCGLSGWGWQDNAYGTGALGPDIYFATSGPQRVRIQTREDGLGIDQIVLSAVTYLSRSPGATKNDTTILP